MEVAAQQNGIPIPGPSRLNNARAAIEKALENEPEPGMEPNENYQ
jgi:hypothetical protein